MQPTLPPPLVTPSPRLAAALARLDDHAHAVAPPGRRGEPSLRRTAALLRALGDPHRAVPVLHITGTNGKSTTAALAGALLGAAGQRVGVYTSPHLERPNERLVMAGEPIGDEALATLLERVLEAEGPALGDERAGYFELLTVAAFTWFAESGAEAAVVEVGIGGRADATNVADGRVAVVTNVAMDHAEVLGPTLAHIAREKAGIVKARSHLVLGQIDPSLLPIFSSTPARRAWRLGADFGWGAAAPAEGGQCLDLFTPGARYEAVYLGLAGPHHAANASTALGAVEAFLEAPVPPAAVSRALAGAASPGRLEVVEVEGGPCFVLDGAKNPAGAASAREGVPAATGGRDAAVVVVGLLSERDPVEMLSALGIGAGSVLVACPPASPRGLPASVVAQAARRLGAGAAEAPSVGEALDRAGRMAGPGQVVLVTGSFYVVGPARAWLRQARAVPPGPQ